MYSLCSFTHICVCIYIIHKFITCIPVHEAIQTHTEARLHIRVQVCTHGCILFLFVYLELLKHSLSSMYKTPNETWKGAHLCMGST